MTAKFEPLITLAELGYERLDDSECESLAVLYGVEIKKDFLDRPSVSLASAYSIAEARRRAEQEYRDSESRRLTEHAESVKDLQRRCNDAFMAARTAHLAANVGGRGLFGGQVEQDGTATNVGLQSARLIWAAAPAGVRDQVTSIEYMDAGGTMTVPINLAMPLDLITGYAHSAARKY